MATKNGSKRSTSKAVQTLTPDQSGVLDAIVKAWQAEQDAERTHVTGFSASTVRAIADGLKLGVRRDTMATRLGTTSGGLSRHVLLAKSADESITVDGRQYAGTVAALQSGTTTINQLYVILAPSKVSKTNGGKVHASLTEAVAAICKREASYRDNKRKLRLKMLTVRSDWRRAIEALLKHSIGKLDAGTVEAIMDCIPVETPDAETPAAQAA